MIRQVPQDFQLQRVGSAVPRSQMHCAPWKVRIWLVLPSASRFFLIPYQKDYRGTSSEILSPIRLPSIIDIFRQENLVHLVHLYLPDALPFLYYARNHCDPTTQTPCLKGNIDYGIGTYTK